MARRTTKRTAVVKRIAPKKLIQKARSDPDFFDALLRDPGKALAKKGLSLSPKNLKWLKHTLKNVYKISGKHLIRFLVEGNKGKKIIFPWPGKFARPWPRLPHPWPY